MNNKIEKNKFSNEKINANHNKKIQSLKLKIAHSVSNTFFYWKNANVFSQTEFANILNCTQPRVSNILNGKLDNFTIDKLISFSDSIGLNIYLELKNKKPIKYTNQDDFKSYIAELLTLKFIELKRTQNLSQLQLSQLLSSTQPRISNIMNGKVNRFTLDKLIMFCIILGVSIDLNVKEKRAIPTEIREKYKIALKEKKVSFLRK